MSKNINKAVEICKKIYETLSPLGFYPALTGGTLYKDGLRKDIDIVIFRNRQLIDKFEISHIQKPLESIGLYDFNHYGFVTKCKFGSFDIDLFNPETEINFNDEDGYTG